jgi:LmbE family N-acetylglucosaminyl deacetylase
VPVSHTKPGPDNDRLLAEILSAKRVLFVSAHPDDIEWYCGALVREMRTRGILVTFAIGTRGGKGLRGLAKRILEGLRTRHQHNAARILGGAEIVLHDYPDKQLPEHIDEFARDIEALIERDKPDIVFSWDPDSIYNPHLDHQAAAKAARIATEKLGSKPCYFGCVEPNIWFGFDEEAFKIKLRSIAAHRTECPPIMSILGRRYITDRCAGEGEKIGARYAEVFRCEDW